MARIAFLGLGAMGLPMAKNLLAAGHALSVTIHRNPEPAKELELLGAEIQPDIPAAVKGADFLISILPEDREIRQVLLNPALIQAVEPGTVLIEMSSTTSAAMRDLAAGYPNNLVLDAPVSGGVEGAEAGTLSIMCGGEAGTLEKARPILELLGQRIIHVGGIGAGKDVKAVNNLLAAGNLLLAAEAIHLSKKMGLDLDVVYDVIKSSSGQSCQFDLRYGRMVQGEYEGGFKLWLMMKDMRIALAASDGLSMPMSHLAYQLYRLSKEADHDLDMAAVAKIFD